ncbi:fasciclin domain-containing protein [Spirosoma sp.]|uniref:fasciclin domain-containing protein n=1 Tax=Spirosoma sp. TaxID=1899569 RepID=UPI003B3BB9B6
MMAFLSRLPGWIFILVLPLLVVLGCTKNDNKVAAPPTIPDRILEDSQLSLFRAAVAYADVSDALKGGNLTLFAPTDSAFQASGLAGAGALTSMSREQVRSLVLYHVLYGSVASAPIPSGCNPVETVSKGIAFVNKSSDGTTYINNARLIQTDLALANGYIHKINRVLTPATGDLLTALQSNPNLTFLSAAIKRISSNTTLLATLKNALSTANVTIFAPNDDAFKADSRYNNLSAIESADPQTLANILLYHVTSGVLFSNQLQTGSLTSLYSGNRFSVTVTSGQVTVKGNKNATAATIKQADLTANNGVIHVVDKLLQP